MTRFLENIIAETNRALVLFIFFMLHLSLINVKVISLRLVKHFQPALNSMYLAITLPRVSI